MRFFPPNIEATVDELEREEAFRDRIYNDLTGKPVDIMPLFKVRRPGGREVQGNPTVGIGMCLTFPLPRLEARAACAMRCVTNDGLFSRFEWYRRLSDARKRAILNVAYQRGVGGVLGHDEFISRLINDDYAGAAEELVRSDYGKRFYARARRVADLLVRG